MYRMTFVLLLSEDCGAVNGSIDGQDGGTFITRSIPSPKLPVAWLSQITVAFLVAWIYLSVSRDIPRQKIQRHHGGDKDTRRLADVVTRMVPLRAP